MTYISSLSLTMPMQTSIMQAQSSLAQVQQEVSTGTLANLGQSLGAQTGSDLSLKSEIDALNSFSNSNSSVTARLSASSNALDVMVSSAQSLESSLIGASTAGGDMTTLAGSAQSALQTMISGLNTSVGGVSVFGGINTGTTPLANYTGTQTSAAKQAVDAAFSQAFGTTQTSTDASSISGTDMQSFLNNQFASLFSASNWQGTWSSASSTATQSTVAPGQTITSSVSANESAFRQIAEAYTMVTEFTGANLSDSARAAVVSTASSLMNSGIAALTNLQGNVGIAQSAVSNAGTQISAQVGVLQTNVSNYESVDTYALSSQLSSLQTQLEASYELTSRLQSLSLANYLTS